MKHSEAHPEFPLWDHPIPHDETDAPSLYPASESPALSRRIPLLADPLALTAAWRELGEIWVMSRNTHAALAEFMAYPTLVMDPHNPCASDANRRLSVDFSAWHRVWALEQDTVQGPTVGFEVRDRQDQALHKVCLAPHTNRSGFAHLMQLHELGLPPFRQDPPGAGTAQEAPWNSVLSTRARWLATLPMDQAQPFPVSLLMPVLEHARTGQFPIRTVLFGRASNQAHIGILQTVERRSGVLFGGSGSGGFHCYECGIGTLWLASFPCPCCGREKWTLEAYDHEDRVLMTWASADESLETPWRDAIRRALVSAVRLPLFGYDDGHGRSAAGNP